MTNNILKNIETQSFEEANEAILEICRKKIKLSPEDIKFILNFQEKELVNIFFYQYSLLDQKDFIIIESFINSNLDNEDREFVSDLIYIALDFGLDLNYTKILSFLKIKEEDEDLIVLASLEYLHKNNKPLYYKELIENLEYVRNNDIYYQNEQLLASLILFRITHKSSYLSFIKELIKSDNSNLRYFENILKSEIYNEVFFDLTEIKKILIL